jgi:hypothetical protein
VEEEEEDDENFDEKPNQELLLVGIAVGAVVCPVPLASEGDSVVCG